MPPLMAGASPRFGPIFVGTKAPDTFHEEGLYAFRFDVNGDSHEEVTFKFASARLGMP
jgi:hypothetical protein